MDATPNLILPYILPSQAQKHVTHNEAIQKLDALAQLAVKSRSLAAPPATPGEGDRYIPAAGSTGVWAGWDLNVAHYIDGAWTKLPPRAGWLCWVEDEGVVLKWTGSQWLGLHEDLVALEFMPTLSFATPGDLSVSYATRDGCCWRLGDLVIALVHIAATPTYSTASGQLRIGGLPCAVAGPVVANTFQHGNIIYPTGATTLVTRPEQGSDYFICVALGNGVATAITAAEVVSGLPFTARGLLIYRAD